MRKFVIAVILFVIFAAVPAFAETRERNESEFYYINISLEMIWPYRAGYIVQYRRGVNRIGRLYLPLEWFSASASKGEIITLPRGASWPSLSIYYRNGEFSHVRLCVHPWAGHQTWGVIPQGVNIDDRFDDIETLRVNFR